MAPDELHRARRGEARPASHAEPRGGDVDVDDPDAIALEIVARRDEQPVADRHEDEQGAAPAQPAGQRAGEAEEAGGIRESVHGGSPRLAFWREARHGGSAPWPPQDPAPTACSASPCASGRRAALVAWAARSSSATRPAPPPSSSASTASPSASRLCCCGSGGAAIAAPGGPGARSPMSRAPLWA